MRVVVLCTWIGLSLSASYLFISYVSYTNVVFVHKHPYVRENGGIVWHRSV